MQPWTLLPPPSIEPPTAVELAVSGHALALAGALRVAVVLLAASWVLARALEHAGLAEPGRYSHAPATATLLAGAALAGAALQANQLGLACLGVAGALAPAVLALGGALRDELREVWASLRWSVGR